MATPASPGSPPAGNEHVGDRRRRIGQAAGRGCPGRCPCTPRRARSKGKSEDASLRAPGARRAKVFAMFMPLLKTTTESASEGTSSSPTRVSKLPGSAAVVLKRQHVGALGDDARALRRGGCRRRRPGPGSGWSRVVRVAGCRRRRSDRAGSAATSRSGTEAYARSLRSRHFDLDRQRAAFHRTEPFSSATSSARSFSSRCRMLGQVAFRADFDVVGRSDPFPPAARCWCSRSRRSSTT